LSDNMWSIRIVEKKAEIDFHYETVDRVVTIALYYFGQPMWDERIRQEDDFDEYPNDEEMESKIEKVVEKMQALRDQIARIYDNLIDRGYKVELKPDWYIKDC